MLALASFSSSIDSLDEIFFLNAKQWDLNLFIYVV